MSNVLDDMRVGSDLMQNSPISGVLCGMSIQESCRRYSWDCVDHLTAEQAQAASVRLRKICDRDPSLAEVLIREKIFTQHRMLALFARPHWRTDALHEDGTILPENPPRFLQGD